MTPQRDLPEHLLLLERFQNAFSELFTVKSEWCSLQRIHEELNGGRLLLNSRDFGDFLVQQPLRF